MHPKVCICCIHHATSCWTLSKRLMQQSLTNTEYPTRTRVQAAAQSARDRASAKVQLQQQRVDNGAPQRPTEETLSRREASIKKNGALAKKLRVLTEATLDGALKDMRATNQAKFLSEAVSALVSAAAKPSRVACVLQVRPSKLRRTVVIRQHCSQAALAHVHLLTWDFLTETRWQDGHHACAGAARAAPHIFSTAKRAPQCTHQSL